MTKSQQNPKQKWRWSWMVGALALLCVVLALMGCGAAEETATPVAEATEPPTALPEPTSTLEPTETPAPTNTPNPTSTPIPTNTPEPTDTPKPPTATPAPTAVPEEVRTQVQGTYHVTILILGMTDLLNEAALKVQSGEMDSLDAWVTTTALSVMAASVDEAIAETAAPSPLAEFWDTLVALHEQSKGILARWFDQEIESGQVAIELEPVLAEMEIATQGMEGAIATMFGSDPAKMAAVREESIAELREILEPDPDEQPAEAAPSSSGGGDLEILSHHSYVDGRWYHIVGEVQNSSDRPMEFVKIVATLYDADGKMSGTDFTYTDLDAIPPGGRAPFLLGMDEWVGTESYKLQVQGSPGVLPRQDLEVASHEHYVDGDWLHVRGEVLNTGDTPAEFVKIVITLYDADGQVVGTDFTYTDLDTVPAGGTSPFEAGTDHWPGFDHYDISVQGR